MRIRVGTVRTGAILTVAGFFLSPGPSSADTETGHVRVAASERYDKGRVHRFALGGGYRDLWKAEIELPVLDIGSEGGGLTPTRRFGGLQTAVLGFQGQDGRSYTFRGTDKDPTAVLDPQLRETFLRSVVQDQMAAQHPGGPVAATVLSEAAGVLTIRERMVVMPDDPGLGDFREEFAGMVGTFYEYPLPANDTRAGFHDATEIIDHEELYERLRADYENEVLVEAFLRARLLDLLLGDFDRHRKQWRWAKLPGESRWQPIPEDRDMAFSRYEGAAPRIASLYTPILQRYGPRYPFSIKGLTLHGWEQDRWLLSSLDWEEWEPIARDMQARISDDVIDRAIEALPPEYAVIDGARLREGLRGRRDRLEEGARRFYEHLAREVDIQATNSSEQVEIDRSSDGSMLIEIRKRSGSEDGAPSAPVFSRRFIDDETREVRLYLRDGNDSVAIAGEPGSIQLRVVSADGSKQIDDSEGGGTRIYDSEGEAEVRKGPGTYVDHRHYELPSSDSGFVDVEGVPPRDWGTDTIPIPQFGYEKDVGVYVGTGVVHTRYGFRKHPWASKHSLSAAWASEANQPRVRYEGRVRPENSKVTAELDIIASGIEILRFNGFGNEVDFDGSDKFFRVRNQQYRFAPSLRVPIWNDRFDVAFGPWVEYSRTKNGDRLIDVLDPYGAGKFGSTGLFLNFQYDTRETVPDANLDLALPLHSKIAAGYPTSGLLFDVTGEVSPEIWDVDRTYGSIAGSLSGYLSVGENARATLGVRVGGKATFGRTPYFAAAYIGGGGSFTGDATVRGYRAQRFAGDESVFVNTDLRILIGRVKLIFPGDYGVLGFFDVGRVFLDGESSDDWHPSGGGGLWFSPLTRTNTISLSVAASSEDTLFYVRVGFHY
jgi:hypothetical protein